MSSSNPAADTSAPAEGSKRKELVGKYVDKFKKGLKRMSSIREPKSRATTPAPEAAPMQSETLATAPPTEEAAATVTEAAPATEQPKPEQPKPEQPKPGQQEEPEKQEATEGEASKPEVARTVSGPMYIRSAIQQERARALFAKYGLTLETPDWVATGSPAPIANPQRVEKPIRMRVRRTCHRCNTTYGPDRICVKCEHRRCKRCPRFPPKKPKREGEPAKTAEKEERAKSRDGKLKAYSPTGPLMAEIKAQGLVTQRIKRTCHKCNTEFVARTAQVCPTCGHIRCTKCPKEALKTRYWAGAFSGEVQSEESEREMLQRVQRVYRKTRQRVRWSCDQCSSVFIEGSKVCRSCQHKRCDSCTRMPPKRVRKEHDPDIVKSVERKLADLMKSETPAVS